MTLRRTPLFDWHKGHGGRMVEFGGWEMPVQYSSIVDEHQTVRSTVGLFDISHMGRLQFHGSDAATLLGLLLTCRVDDLVDGQIRYGLICNAAGGVLDDILVNRVTSDSYGLVVNASNREKIVAWIHEQLGRISGSTGTLNVTFKDDTEATAMLAVQGPHALSLMNEILVTDLSSMKYYSGRSLTADGHPVFVSRTGYTGEDGFEIIVPNNQAVALWERLLARGEALGIKPCGLGCRDTLRLEAAMPLYGHELSESVDPLTAGLKFAVKLDKPQFIGREALARIDATSGRPKRVGLKLASRRIAREHSDVYIGDSKIGQVTSGTFSPTLEQSIAMAYLDASHAALGTAVEIDIRGKREPAEVVGLPFYKRKS